MQGQYVIPVNFTDAGKLLGAFPIRNAIEALCIVIPIALLCMNLPLLAFMPRLIVTLSACVLFGGFALMGVNDDSLSQFLVTWFRWRQNRACLSYRGAD